MIDYRGFRFAEPTVLDRDVQVPVFKLDEHGETVLDENDEPVVESTKLERQVSVRVTARPYSDEARGSMAVGEKLGCFIPLAPVWFDDNRVEALCYSIPHLIGKIMREADRRLGS